MRKTKECFAVEDAKEALGLLPVEWISGEHWKNISDQKIRGGGVYVYGCLLYTSRCV